MYSLSQVVVGTSASAVSATTGSTAPGSSETRRSSPSPLESASSFRSWIAKSPTGVTENSKVASKSGRCSYRRSPWMWWTQRLIVAQTQDHQRLLRQRPRHAVSPFHHDLGSHDPWGADQSNRQTTISELALTPANLTPGQLWLDSDQADTNLKFVSHSQRSDPWMLDVGDARSHVPNSGPSTNLLSHPPST